MEPCLDGPISASKRTAGELQIEGHRRDEQLSRREKKSLHMVQFPTCQLDSPPKVVRGCVKEGVYLVPGPHVVANSNLEVGEP